jgi:hypothetical protein
MPPRRFDITELLNFSIPAKSPCARAYLLGASPVGLARMPYEAPYGARFLL